MEHQPWLTDTKPFSRSTLADTGTVVPIHAWVFFTGALARYGEAGTGTIHLAEYMLELAKAFAVDPGRAVWLQEYGVAPEWLTDMSAERFVELTTTAAVSVDSLWGITWWCSHDVDRRLGGFIELEYDLGLLTTDNVAKPAGEAFRKMVHAVRSGGVPLDTERSTALVLPDEFTPDLGVADAFFALVDEGIAPAIVLESRTGDAGYLRQRGITALRRPFAVRTTSARGSGT